MLDWKEVGKGLLNIAPTLATALGGPPGGMIVGGAVKLLSQFLGLPETATPDMVAEAAAKLGPDQYVELQRIDGEYKQQLIAAGVKLEEIAAGDRDSARKNQAATGSKTPDILAFLLTAGFFGALASLIIFPVPDANKAIVYSMVGILGTVWVGSMAYWNGTTAAGARKTELLSQAPAIKMT